MSQLVLNLSRVLSQITENTIKTNVGLSANVLQVRYRKTHYPRRHVEPEFVRKQMLAVCEPIFPKDKRLDSEKCYNLRPKREREIHPLDRLLAEDMKQELRSSRMICFFHLNSLTNREKKFTSNQFQHEDMYLRYYNPDIATLAMSGTKYESAVPLCSLREVTVLFSAEPQITKLLKITKKCPQLILLAAIIDDRFLNVNDLKEYSRLPDLQTLRTQLSHTLAMASKSIADKTVYPIHKLSNSLDLYIRDQNK